ncbi:copper-binding protein [Parvularcula oceani]|uniref:copper-binding protein n=1 Tax=Parvularcula oceani TaxID=1247963 RepID=UPI000689A73B|nr:copper-binding protein [Parvularcula oceani]
MNKILLTIAVATLLAACGSEEVEAPDQRVTEAGASDHSMMDGMEGQTERTDGAMGMAEGRVVEIDQAGNRIRLEHDAIEGVGMDAMTMFFEVKRDVDLSGLQPGEEVHFMIDRGRDGTYRIGAICEIGGAHHEDCMGSMKAMMPDDMHGAGSHDH